MNRLVITAAYLAIALVFMLAGRLVSDVLFRSKRAPRQPNLALSVRHGGLYLAIAIAMTSALQGNATSFVQGVLEVLRDGAVIVFALIAAQWLNEWLIVPGLDNDQAVAEGNTAVALTEFGSYIATGMIASASFGGGEGSWLTAIVFFVVGQLALVGGFWAQELLLPGSFVDAVKRGREGAGVAVAGRGAPAAWAAVRREVEATAELAPRGGALTVDGRAALKGFNLGDLETFLGKGAAAGPADLAVAAKGVWPGLEVNGDLDLARARLDLGTGARKAPGEDAHLSFAGRLVGEGMDLPKVRVRWRGAAIEGRAAAARLRPLEVTFAADTARLDLDALLAAPAAPQGAEPKTSGGPDLFGAAAAWAAPPRVTAGAAGTRAAATGGPSASRAEGTVHAKALRWHGVEAGDVRAALTYRDAILGFRNVTGSVFGGRLAGAGTVDLRGRYPSLAASGRLEEAQLQPLVAALAPGKKVEARGILTAEARITSPALVPGNTLGTLAGSGSLAARDGRVAGYKPLERLGDTLMAFPGGANLLKARLDEFQRLTGTFTLDMGFVRTQDLTLLRPDGQAKAAGSMNLLNTSLDFNVAIRLGKVGLDAKVTGTAADPLVVPTMAHLDKRFEMEFDRALKGGDRSQKVQDLLKNLLR